MASMFTFVNVELNEKNRISRSRARAISSEDSVRIRSLAAASPWNRQRIREEDMAGRRAKNKAKVAAKKAQTSATTEHEASDQSVFQSPEARCGSDLENLSHYYPFGTSLVGLQEEENDAADETIPLDASKVLAKLQCSSIALPKRQATTLSSALAKIVSDVPKYVRTGRVDPFWTLPIPYNCVISTALKFFFTYLVPSIPVLDKEFDEKAVLKFWKISRDEPAFLLGVSLFSSTILCAAGMSAASETPIEPKHLYWLKGSTFSALNKSLQKGNKTRADIDALVGALINLITYEQCFGEESIRDMHGRALAQLLDGEPLNYAQRRMVEYEMAPRHFSPEPASPCEALDRQFQAASNCVAEALNMPR